SPYVGLKIRNKEANPRAKLREQIESAADAYWQFDNGWISDMKCGDRSHEYLLFVKEPKNVLALLDELEASEKQNAMDVQIKARLCRESNSLHDRLRAAENRIAELEARTVTLPEALNSYAGVKIYRPNDVIEAIRAAGIGVKGE
ncbi:MAG: hypothetical protein RSC68_34160, partial [Acinetobacter sp.]